MGAPWVAGHAAPRTAAAAADSGTQKHTKLVAGFEVWYRQAAPHTAAAAAADCGTRCISAFNHHHAS
jgi:hypothetical protein